MNPPEKMSLKDIMLDGERVKMARFKYFRDETLYYETEDGYRFGIPVADTGTGEFQAEEKTSTLMRWIRKSLAREEESVATQ